MANLIGLHAEEHILDGSEDKFSAFMQTQSCNVKLTSAGKK